MEEKLKILFAIIFLWYPLSTLGRRGDMNPEVIRSSVIFVFDITGSMSSELNDVKLGASKILREINENLRKNKERIIDDYILVPFDDPDIQNTTRTANITEFDEKLKELKIHKFGQGCPEPSLQAIKKGLEMGRGESLLFVFTDADPRDTALLPDILSLIVNKRIKVLFVLTGYCGSDISQQFQQIAVTSNGEVFDTSKLDFSKVLNFIHFEVKPNKIDLTAVHVNETKNSTGREFHVPVDNTITDLTISLVTDKKIEFSVINPLGRVFNDSSFCNKSLDIANKRMCSVQDPVVGNWTLLLETNSSFTLRVFGSSNITLNFGFEVFQPNQTTGANNTNSVLCQPIAGTENILLFKLNGSSQVKSLTTGEMISMEGQILLAFALERVPEYTDLYHASFIPANSSYHLQINGVTKADSKFRRVTSVAFSSSSGNNTQESASCIAHTLPFISHKEIDKPAKNQSPTMPKQSWFMCMIVTITIVMEVCFRSY